MVETTPARKVYPQSGNAHYFQRECDVYRQLGNHLNIAELQQIQGFTLYLEARICLQHVIQNTFVSGDQKAIWIQQPGKGLLHMHSKGVIHSDLRMTNAITSKQGCAKWIDFGASGIDDKPAWDSYDAYSYKPRDPSLPPTSIEIDIFAFGCTIFGIDPGVPPCFLETQDMSMGATIRFIEGKFLQNEFPSTAGLRFEKAINGCWNGHYRTMEDVMRDLDPEGPTPHSGVRSSRAVGPIFPLAVLTLAVVWCKRHVFL